MNEFKDQVVLITGSCGTVGSELVRQLVEFEAGHIVCLDNSETELFFQLEQYRSSGRVTGHLADIRDVGALMPRMRGVDVVLHAAALKHVGLCEDSPSQAIATNILGTKNVIEAARGAGVGRVIFTSSDKAVNPTNVMGTSKLMGERLNSAAAAGQLALGKKVERPGTIFASTRFGNVIGSRGSVVPLFIKQIKAGGPVTLTDELMTRFIMTIEEAAALVLKSAWLACGGEVFVTKMPVIRIKDLAAALCELIPGGAESGIEIIGPKPGEKMYEELVNDEEVRRTYDFGEFLVVVPALSETNDFPYLAGMQKIDDPYNSANSAYMGSAELLAYLRDCDLLGNG